MHIKLKRAPGIYLAGFMGSGKSTVCRLLADRLGWQAADLDREIEAQEQDTIGHIFESRGEAEFRRLETAMIGSYVRHIERGSPTVMALGGGAFARPENYELIRYHGISIWLDCSLETIRRRLAADPQDRPLARDPVAFCKLFDERQESYRRADFRVDGNCDPSVIVEAIIALPLWK
jgi:shikimate kinase